MINFPPFCSLIFKDYVQSLHLDKLITFFRKGDLSNLFAVDSRRGNWREEPPTSQIRLGPARFIECVV